MINEAEYRRPGFDEESVPVEWPGIGTLHLPPPRIQPAGEGSRLLELADRLHEGGDDVAILEAIFGMTASLLNHNYALPPELLGTILVFEPSRDPEAGGLPPPWDEVLEILQGIPPAAERPWVLQALISVGHAPSFLPGIPWADAYEAARMAEWAGRVPNRAKWIIEYRSADEIAGWETIGGI